MTDGPFRNAQLSSRWKRYGEDLVSDVTSANERAMRACHSMLGDLELTTLGRLLSALKAKAQSLQMDLDPVSATESICASHPNSPLTDILQKHLAANLRDRMHSERALDQAIASTTRDWIAITKNRLDEECIRARDLGNMSREAYVKAIQRNEEGFATIKPGDLSDALTSGDKNAFKQSLQKKTGVDEGPDE